MDPHVKAVGDGPSLVSALTCTSPRTLATTLNAQGYIS